MEMTVFVGDVEVELGQDEYLEEKVANLNKILPRLEGQRGTLHLENFTGRNETVSFTPSDAPETVTDGSDGSAGGEDGAAGSEDGAAGSEGGQEGDASVPEGDASAGDVPEDAGEPDEPEEDTGVVITMVFNSSGTLVYNVHISNGVVVDAYGNQVPGVTLNEDGNVVDAYMNVFDSTTGELIQ